MGEMLASAVVTAAGNKLGGVVVEELGLLCNLREDLEFIKNTLRTIKAVLKDAERQSMENNERVTLWLQRLKSAAYDIEDMLDEFRALNPEAGDGVEDDSCFGKVSHFCSSLSSSHRNIAHKIKKMKKRLEEIQAQQRLAGFNFEMDSNSYELSVIAKRETTSGVKESIVGREKEQDIIISSLLTESREDVAVIAIHGFGGMGKTTLARLAFNDETIVKTFDKRVWVYVSMKYDLKKIGNSILSLVDDEYRSHENLESLQQRLKTVLDGKTLLIVLDDIWEEDDQELEKLKGFLNFGTKECKVILTTRIEQIATKMKPVLAHKLEVLSDEECWLLFKQTAGEVADDMEQIGKEIVKKCKGVPLAIKSVGFLMQFKRGVAEWEAIRDSNIWKMEEGAPSSTKGVLPSLRLSFNHLPAHLKLCFAYCSIFPKGCKINKDLLIQQWIAMGFIKSSGTAGASQEALGQEYLEMLVGMSFLQASETPLSVASKRAISPRQFQMHDLIHDLATFAAGEEVCVLDFEGKDKVSAGKNDCRYAVFLNCSQASTLLKSAPSKARALHFRNCEELQLPKKAFLLSKFLRVLDLSGCSIVDLPRYITSQPKLLKFLDASGLQNPGPPKHLSSLCSLHGLNLSYSSLRNLPSHIGNLRKLHYLNLHNCSHLSELPESFVQLKNLLHLDLSNCLSLQGLPTSFGNLDKLSFLDLSCCHELRELPSDFGKLRKLRILYLSNCPKLHKFPESLCEILHLEYLDLSGCFSLVELPECFGNLRYLCTLDLSHCQELVVLPKSFTRLMNLEELILRACLKLKELPMSFANQCKLRFLDLSSCIQLSAFPESLSKLVNLKYLSVFNCTALRRMPGYDGNLEKLENLVELSLGYLELIDHLRPLGQLPRLRKLVIESMPNLRQVGSDFSGGSAPFPRLRTLEIENMSNLEEWHTTQLTNNAEEHIFPVLEELYVRRCPKLRFVPFLPPCTSKCSIEFSDEVFLLGQHNGPPSYHMPTSALYCEGAFAGFTGLQYFTTLKSLTIGSMKLEMLSSSWGESIRHLTSLESLRMSGYAVGGGEWFGALTSLRILHINRCPLPLDFAQHVLRLAALETLELCNCWEAIKVLSEVEIEALIRKISEVKIFWCGPVKEAKWKNGVLTYCSFYGIHEMLYRRQFHNYDDDDVGVWPTILPGWPKYPELRDYDGESKDDDGGGIEEGKPMEDDHRRTEDEAGPSGTK